MLTFRLANQQFGIEMSNIREIVRMPQITRVPLSPDYVLGVANLRGNVTPVLNGSARLGRVPEKFTNSARVLVLAVGGSTLGFSVDEVVRIISVPADQIEVASPQENKTSASMVSGEMQHAGATIFKISPEKLAEGEGKVSSSVVAISAKHSEISRNPEAARKVVVIQIGSEEFGIDIAQVSEVIRFIEPTPAPNAPAFLAGLITVRSEAIPVVDLRALMHRASLREETSRRTIQLRAELEKARDVIDRPQMSAGFLQNANRMLDVIGVRSASAASLLEKGKALHREISSSRAATASVARIQEIADRLSEIDHHAANDPDRRVLIIETDRSRFGLAVDRVSQVLDVPLSSIQPPPPIIPQSGVQLEALAHLQNPGRLVLLLNLAEMIEKNSVLSAHTQRDSDSQPHDIMPTENRSTQAKWVSFIVGEEQFGIPIEDVIEIGRVETITRVPSAPKFIRGVANLRGEIIPVIDLRTRFAMEAQAATTQSRMLYIRSGSVKLGLVVDRVLAILELPQAQPPPPAICSKRVSEYLAGIAQYGDQVVLLLGAERFLTESEQERIEEASKKLVSAGARPGDEQ